MLMHCLVNESRVLRCGAQPWELQCTVLCPPHILNKQDSRTAWCALLCCRMEPARGWSNLTSRSYFSITALDRWSFLGVIAGEHSARATFPEINATCVDVRANSAASRALSCFCKLQNSRFVKPFSKIPCRKIQCYSIWHMVMERIC